VHGRLTIIIDDSAEIKHHNPSPSLLHGAVQHIMGNSNSGHKISAQDKYVLSS
jgi:hypothetical protein